MRADPRRHPRCRERTATGPCDRGRFRRALVERLVHEAFQRLDHERRRAREDARHSSATRTCCRRDDPVHHADLVRALGAEILAQQDELHRHLVGQPRGGTRDQAAVKPTCASDTERCFGATTRSHICTCSKHRDAPAVHRRDDGFVEGTRRSAHPATSPWARPDVRADREGAIAGRDEDRDRSSDCANRRHAARRPWITPSLSAFIRRPGRS